MKRFSIAALMATVILTCPLSVSAETLSQSVEHALSNHPSIEVAKVGQIISKEDRLEARSGLFPEISANVSAGRIYGDTSTTRGLSVDRGAAYSWLGEGSAAVTQPLFDGFETSSRMSAAQARLKSADLNLIDVREAVAYEAVSAHIGVLQARDTLNKVRSYNAVIDDYLERIKYMVAEGVADKSESSQAHNISLMLQGTIADYEGQFSAAMSRYQEVIGSMPTSELIKPVSGEQKIFKSVEQAVKEAKKSHPLIKYGQQELQAAHYDINVEKSSVYPNLNGEVSYLKRDQAEEIGGEVVDARALLKISWDFETGGAQGARERRSKAQHSEVVAQNNERLRKVEAGVRRAYIEMETAKKQTELTGKREIITAGLFEAYKTQFEGARVRLLQLMQAENQLFNAQLDSIVAKYRFYLAQYGVMASSGQLTQFVASNQRSINNTLVSKAEASRMIQKDVVPMNTASDDGIIESLK